MAETRVNGFGALAFVALALGMVGIGKGVHTTVVDPVVVAAPAPVLGPVGQAVDVPTGTITGFPNGTSVRAVVSIASGSLSLPAQASAVTVPFGYPALGVVGPQLAIEGTEDAVNTALGHLQWTASVAGPAALKLDAVPAGSNYDPDSGHYYQLVTDGAGITWDTARTAADAASSNGYHGYLATITTLEEEAFLSRTTPSAGWIGASDGQGTGTWQWVSGPEASPTPTTFFDSSCAVGLQGVCTGTSGLAMWSSNEPNGTSGADVALFEPPATPEGSGLWVASAADPTSAITSYVVEYGGLTGDIAALEGHATATLTGVVAPGAPTGVKAAAGTGAATVSWVAPTTTGGAPLTSYVVTGSPAGSCSVSAPATSCIVTGLAAGTTHSFRVTASNVAGPGPQSARSNDVTPRFATTVGLVVSPASGASAGQVVTLTATVKASAGASDTPTGWIVFKDGTSTLGPVSLMAGSASMRTAGLSVGNHQLSATYPGDATLGASNSGPVALAVVAPSSTTTPATTAPATDSGSTVPGSTEPGSTGSGSTDPGSSTTVPAAGSSSTTAPTNSAAATTNSPTTSATSSDSADPGVHVVFDVGVGTKLTDTRITVRAEGLRPGSTLTVTAHSTPVALASIAADSSGAATKDVTLPTTLDDGEHQIIVEAIDANGKALSRAVPFAIHGGILSRVGAVETSPATPNATAPGTAPTNAIPATSASAGADSGSTGGSSGLFGLPIPLVLVVVASALGGFLWWRSKQASRPQTAGQARPKSERRPDADRHQPQRMTMPSLQDTGHPRH